MTVCKKFEEFLTRKYNRYIYENWFKKKNKNVCEFSGRLEWIKQKKMYIKGHVFFYLSVTTNITILNIFSNLSYLVSTVAINK